MSNDSRRPVAVVTGASAGVGRATAVALGRRGFDVAVLARGRAGLEKAAQLVEESGARALLVQADVADWSAVDAAAIRIEEELGEIDVWVNNAMTTVFAPVIGTDPADIRRATDVTYLGQVHGTLAALRRMLPRDRGRIVNVGSALAYVGIPLQAPYCGAKFACRGFTESVHAELLASGTDVTISMVHLPAVDTPQFGWCATAMPRHPRPVPPTYTPELAAERIVDTAMDGRRTRMVGSWNRGVIAGARLAPGLLAHFTARTAIDDQQTDEPVPPDRPSNLDAPLDEAVPWTGRFGEEARGVRHPGFLRALPGTFASLGRAALSMVRRRAGARARRRAMTERLAQTA